MASNPEWKKRQRSDYRFFLDYRTRWNDNDMYDHMNNSVYNFLFDSIINAYLIEHCHLRPPESKQYGLAVYSCNNYYASIAYPAMAELALRVNKLGKTSVTYEVALFERGIEHVKAVGEFIHVFVERSTGKPPRNGMDEKLREGLSRLYVGREHSKL